MSGFPAVSPTARARSTAIGMAAIALWASLALLTTLTAGIPPFELLALSFGVAFVASAAWLSLRGTGAWRQWRQPWPVWATGFGGIFGYHALYFFALKAAPAAQASLIAYLWPLLIVLLAGLAAGQRLQARQVLGALLGLSGTAGMLWARAGPQALAAGGSGHAAAGYAAAFACALVWAAYSVFNRRFHAAPSSLIGGVCGLVACAGGLCHAAFEPTVVPNAAQWGAIAALGLGPVGLAFFAWDHATKHGSLPMLGALSYLAPLLSTLLLMALGRAPASVWLLGAAGLIVAGAVLATAPRRPVAKAGEP